MNRAVAIYHSSVGKKALMAITGIIGIGFVIGHMIGNLQVFQGPEKLNHYAEALRRLGPLLYLARLILISAVVVHVIVAYQLTRMSWAARAHEYKRWRPMGSDYASRTMRWTGPILLLFLIYHLLDFTFGAASPNYIQGDVYRNVIASFSIWWITAFYVISMLCLGLHMYHGIWSMFQSLGLNDNKWTGTWRALSVVITGVVVIGNIVMPVAVLAGFVR
jgi:succinate dehydrogenase / fumarate reductase cytochrome b subunit